MRPMHLATPGLTAIDAAARQLAVEVRVLLALLREPPADAYGEVALLQTEALALMGDGRAASTPEEIALARAYIRQLRHIRDIETRLQAESMSLSASRLAERIAHALVGEKTDA